MQRILIVIFLCLAALTVCSVSARSVSLGVTGHTATISTSPSISISKTPTTTLSSKLIALYSKSAKVAATTSESWPKPVFSTTDHPLQSVGLHVEDVKVATPATTQTQQVAGASHSLTLLHSTPSGQVKTGQSEQFSPGHTEHAKTLVREVEDPDTETDGPDSEEENVMQQILHQFDLIQHSQKRRTESNEADRSSRDIESPNDDRSHDKNIEIDDGGNDLRDEHKSQVHRSNDDIRTNSHERRKDAQDIDGNDDNNNLDMSQSHDADIDNHGNNDGSREQVGRSHRTMTLRNLESSQDQLLQYMSRSGHLGSMSKSDLQEMLAKLTNMRENHEGHARGTGRSREAISMGKVCCSFG